MTFVDGDLPHDGHTELYYLEKLRLLDARGEAALDALTRIARDSLDVPVALICFLDDSNERQVIKSACGLSIDVSWEIPYSHSFCKHVKRSNAPLVVEDARAHPVVCDNPGIEYYDTQAYLGVPVHAPDGSPWGTFCVLDPNPRSWSEEDRCKLTDLALCVTREVSLRKSVLDGFEARSQAIAAREALRHQNACRDRITQSFMRKGQSIETRFEGLLENGTDILGMDCARIVKVAGDTAEVIANFVVPSCREKLTDIDASIAIDGTYAGKILSGEDRLALADCAALGPSLTVGLCGAAAGSYIGAPLIVEGTAFGVLEFVGAHPRSAPWGEADLALFDHIRMVASAHLEMFKHIRSLRASEAAIASVLLDHRETLRRCAEMSAAQV